MATGRDTPEGRRKLEASTAERLAEIVAGAERAAKQVIDEAEVQAHRQLSDAEAEAAQFVAARVARLGELADRLAAGAEAIGRQADELLAELRRAGAELGTDDGAAAPDSAAASGGSEGDGSGPLAAAAALESPTDPGAQRKSHLSAVTFVEARPADPSELEARTPGAADSGARTPAGARLLATQMAVSGSSREEIEQRLRNGFEIEDPAPILDAILGPESRDRR